MTIKGWKKDQRSTNEEIIYTHAADSEDRSFGFLDADIRIQKENNIWKVIPNFWDIVPSYSLDLKVRTFKSKSKAMDYAYKIMRRNAF